MTVGRRYGQWRAELGVNSRRKCSKLLRLLLERRLDVAQSAQDLAGAPGCVDPARANIGQSLVEGGLSFMDTFATVCHHNGIPRRR